MPFLLPGGLGAVHKCAPEVPQEASVTPYSVLCYSQRGHPEKRFEQVPVYSGERVPHMVGAAAESSP